jgi:hypothetical protein
MSAKTLLKTKVEHKNILVECFSSMQSRDGEPLREKTISNYVQKINKICFLCTGKPFDGCFKFLDKPQVVCQTLEKSGLKSLKDYITPAVRLLRSKGWIDEQLKPYLEYMKDFKEKEYSVRKDNVATKSEIENYTPLDVIQAKIKGFNPSTSDELLYKTILSLYFMGDSTSLVPRNNLQDFKLCNASKKPKSLNDSFNYFTIQNGVPKSVIMNRYKTQNLYGRQKFELSPFQSEILTSYLKSSERQLGDFAFQKNSREMTDQEMSELLKRASLCILDKSMNVDLARKINALAYAMEGLHTINQDETQARRFLHSTAQQREYVKVNLA